MILLLLLVALTSALVSTAPDAPAPDTAALDAMLDVSVVDAAADGLLARYPDARVSVLGKLHETVESPLMAAVLMQRLLSQSPVTVALEIIAASKDCDASIRLPRVTASEPAAVD